jgi:hypothetical protein
MIKGHREQDPAYIEAILAQWIGKKVCEGFTSTTSNEMKTEKFMRVNRTLSFAPIFL